MDEVAWRSEEGDRFENVKSVFSPRASNRFWELFFSCIIWYNNEIVRMGITPHTACKYIHWILHVGKFSPQSTENVNN